jgi:hypothetical protein
VCIARQDFRFKLSGELKEEIDKLKPALEKMSIEDTVKSIREDRDSR